MNSKINISRYLYGVAAWVFVAGILIQVFLISLTFLLKRPSMPTHIGLGHGLAIAPLAMVVLAYTGQLLLPMKVFTWLTLVIYVLLADVVFFIQGFAPLVAAFHPVLAVLLFGVSGFLAIRTLLLARETQPKPILKIR